MLSHGDDSNILNTNHHHLEFRVSSRISTTFSSSSSSNTSSNLSMFSNTTRTMEEVWKEINLTTTNHPNAAVKAHRGFILQDYLAKPYSCNDGTNTSVSLNVPFDQVLGSVDSASGLLGHNIGGMRILTANGGDRRHMRMIKNRESAARSRARKQAYTHELENEVERLKVENSKLKRQQKQLELATTAPIKKKGLQRTSTAPF